MSVQNSVQNSPLPVQNFRQAVQNSGGKLAYFVIKTVIVQNFYAGCAYVQSYQQQAVHNFFPKYPKRVFWIAITATWFG